jgi:hypothetical protein
MENVKFDPKDDDQVKDIIKVMKGKMELDDYALMKLEVVIKNEMPFYVVTKKLALDWILKNFIA